MQMKALILQILMFFHQFSSRLLGFSWVAFALCLVISKESTNPLCTLVGNFKGKYKPPLYFALHFQRQTTKENYKVQRQVCTFGKSTKALCTFKKSTNLPLYFQVKVRRKLCTFEKSTKQTTKVSFEITNQSTKGVCTFL